MQSDAALQFLAGSGLPGELGEHVELDRAKQCFRSPKRHAKLKNGVRRR
jgi:hypothetical protein